VEITLLAVGKLRPSLRELADDYIRRLGRQVKLREVEVREAGRAPTVEAQREEEGRRLTAKLPSGSVLVALARSGSAWSSDQLAREVGKWRMSARPMAVAIGGSIGLDPGFLEQAPICWSLGPLTLPHELARVVVLEQLYRAFAILEGRPYHKG
jgi:23S rRNA (pseudouridine1915-N3)-methyltransferase